VADPGDPAWAAEARATIDRWHHLSAAEELRLLDRAAGFARSRFWEGLGGLVVTDTMCAVVSSLAALVTVNLGPEALRDVTSVLVAPRAVVKKARWGGGVVTEGEACVLGEAMVHGPVRLAWDRIEAERTPGSATSVVIHEIAHKVDMADGTGDGSPPMDRPRARVFDAEAGAVLDALRAGAEAEPLRPYAATNRAELFAVATEAFFLRPVELSRRFPRFYELLSGIYGQDPAASPPS